MTSRSDVHVDTWRRDYLAHSSHGSDAQGHASLERLGSSWPLAYLAVASPERAVDDARVILGLDADRPHVSFVADAADGPRFSIAVAGRPRSLAELLPPLQTFGVGVLSQRAFELVRPDGVTCWLYDFPVAPESVSSDPEVGGRLADAVAAVWERRTDADAFNQLIVRARLGWREVDVLRAYSHYLHQLRTPWGHTRTAAILADHGAIARRLSDLFTLKLGAGEPAHASDLDTLRHEVEAEVDAIEDLAADRLLRAYLEVIAGTVRTNAFDPGFDPTTHALALKLDPASIVAVPDPRPRSEVFVVSPRIRGVHLRFGKVARGGLRWSDRQEDLRTEVLGLATAQVAKNAVIVPTGAKGGFVLTRSGTAAPSRADALAGYREFVSALLDVHDDLDPRTGAPVPARVAYDDTDPYLVVAADKGTATFSDAANEIATDRGFWLGDAFASGGSAGYDHKAMGITAKGAWCSVERHFAEVGLCPERDTFTAVGIGDMSGDVFGNGMLLAPGMKLVAAFDHRHVFLDPDPDPDASYAERLRLFSANGSTWADYSPEAISAGGGVHPRSAKTVPITPQVRSALGLGASTTHLTPGALVSAILRAPVDLLWNGGIGTYVKAAVEGHADADDRGNDHVRVDAVEVRARVVAEGGNLGFTQRARIEYARRGGRINTDALDNSAGVGCSDREVNIKIALQRCTWDGLPEAERLGLLRSMTDAVADLVLAQNRSVNELVGHSRQFAADDLALHGRLIDDLEVRRGLDRTRLSLPGASALADLAATGAGLSSPELAVLGAQVKLDLRDALLAGSLPDEPALLPVLRAYFPLPLREAYPRAVDEHPLRREIIATELANTVVDRAGIGWVHRILENTTASAEDVVRAYLVTTAVFDLPALWERIDAAGLRTDVAGELVRESHRLLDRASRWLLNRRPQPLDVRGEVDRLRPTVAGLFDDVPTWHVGTDHVDFQEHLDAVVAGGAPSDLAERVFGLLERFCLLDVAEVAHESGLEATEVGSLYYAVKERRRIDRLLTGVSGLPRSDRWNALARLGLRDDLYESIRLVVTSVLADRRPGEGPEVALDRWDAALGKRLGATEDLIESSRCDHDLANLAVAARQIRTLALVRAQPSVRPITST
jgi:glutamate dehydrogenase